MSAETGQRPISGLVGVFLVLLGAGLVLDADRTWTGGGIMLAGILCLAVVRRAGGGS